MALGKVLKQNSNLLETLIQINELVKALSDKDHKEKINELKILLEKSAQETRDNNASEASARSALENLNVEKGRNEKLIAEAKNSIAASESARHDAEKQTQKLERSLALLNKEKEEHARSVANDKSSLDKKSEEVAERERVAREKSQKADAVIAEYQEKLRTLKQIAG